MFIKCIFMCSIKLFLSAIIIRSNTVSRRGYNFNKVIYNKYNKLLYNKYNKYNTVLYNDVYIGNLNTCITHTPT